MFANGPALPSTDPPVPLLSALPGGSEPFEIMLPLETLEVVCERLTDTPVADAQLLASLLTGQLSAIEVAADRVTVLNGGRRCRLMRSAGITEALCRVHPGVVTREQVDRAGHAFDLQEKRPPLDQGLRFHAHIDATGQTQAECAQHFCCSEAHVSRCLRAADSSPETRGAITLKRLTAAHVGAVGKVKDPAKREALLRRAEAEGLTSKQLRKLASGREKRPAEKLTTISVHGYVLTFPAKDTPAQFDAGVAGLRDRGRQLVRSVDVKELPMDEIVTRATVVKVDVTVGEGGGG